MGKVKAGLLLMCAQWFADTGLSDESGGRYTELANLCRRDTAEILGELSPHFDVLFPGQVSTAEAAANAASAFVREGVDVVILVNLMWSEDGPLHRFLRDIGNVPLLLWCYSPFRSLPEKVTMLDAFRGGGIVGCLQGSVPLRKAGTPYQFVFGCPGGAKLERELSDYAAAFKARRDIKKLRIGRIGPRCESMMGTWIDEFRLTNELGTAIVPVSYQRLRETADALSDADVSGFIKDLISQYEMIGVSGLSLQDAARAALAVGRIAWEEDLGIVSIEDLNPELHRLLKTRPCLWPPGLRERGVVVGMEADILTAVGLWVSRQFCGHTPMYTEVLTFDPEDNAIVFGHGAMHDPALAGDNRVSIVPDYEFEAADEIEGAWLNFRCRAGQVTLVNMSEGGQGYRIFSFTGESMPVPDETVGFTSAYIKVTPPLEELFEKAVRLGMMQHYALSYGDSTEKLKKFCRIMGIEFVNM
jgi:L-arabinose isomerase